MRIRWVIFKLLDKSTDHVTQTEMIKEIRAMGHDIRLSCGYRDRKKNYGMDAGIIRYFNLPRIRKIRSVFFVAAVWTEIVRTIFIERPDVLLIDYSVNLIAAPVLWACRVLRRGTKVVLDVRTLPVDIRYFRWSIPWFFGSLWLARLQCDGVTFITEAMRRYCFEHVRPGRMRTEIWTSGVNAELFDPGRMRNGLPGPMFRLFYHGGLSLSRGIGSLIRAVKLLKDRGCPADLTLIGNCVDREACLSIIRENGLDGYCRILAPVLYEEVPRLINDCELPVIPFPDFIGWRVSSPIKLIEYMAMGKSLVLTNIDAHRDVLGDADFAFYAKDASPESLAEAVGRAFGERRELERLGRKAREIVLNGYTWRRQAEKLLGFLQTL